MIFCRLLEVCFSLEISAGTIRGDENIRRMGRDMGAARKRRENGFVLVSPSSLLGHTAIPLFCARDDETLV